MSATYKVRLSVLGWFEMIRQTLAAVLVAATTALAKPLLFIAVLFAFVLVALTFEAFFPGILSRP